MLASFFPYTDIWLNWVLFVCVSLAVAVLASWPRLARALPEQRPGRWQTLSQRTSALLCGWMTAFAVVHVEAQLVPTYGLHLIRRGEWGGYGFVAAVLVLGLAASLPIVLLVMRMRKGMLGRFALVSLLAILAAGAVLVPLDRYGYNRLYDQYKADQARWIAAALAARATQPSATSAPAASQPGDNANQ